MEIGIQNRFGTQIEGKLELKDFSKHYITLRIEPLNIISNIKRSPLINGNICHICSFYLGLKSFESRLNAAIDVYKLKLTTKINKQQIAINCVSVNYSRVHGNNYEIFVELRNIKSENSHKLYL